MGSLRFYTAGGVTVEGPDAVVDQSRLPGRQGRLALAHLVVARHTPTPTERLAAALWGEDLPRSWDSSLRAVVSKLRSALAEAGGADTTIDGDGGCYQLRSPGAWVDLEVAAREVDRAEARLRDGDHRAAWAGAATASAIARRPLLPGEDQPWVVVERDRLRGVLVRAFHVLGEVWVAAGETTLAAGAAREAVALEPYQEAGTRLLMRAHLAAGDRAQALVAYDRCRELLAGDLGVDPDPATEALYLRALGPSGATRA